LRNEPKNLNAVRYPLNAILPNEPKPMNFHTENKDRISIKWKLQNEPNAAWPKRLRFGSFTPAAGRPHSGFWLRTSDFILKMTKRTQFENRQLII
jgi:hypothetical protein